VVAAWMVGLLLLFAVGKILSNITLKSIEKDALADGQNKTGSSLRSFYKSLINAGGIYYYISLPIVILLFIGLVGALIYLFLMAGRIPIKLTLFLVVGTCISVYAMIRSLLLKVKPSDPGRELKREEAPKLFELTEEVARTINTRPVDEIRITHGTDLAVYERGTWKEKLGDNAQRILILGTAVLKDFRKNDFKAVLAHEYGHFSHRDTAGGEIALRVMNDMTKYFYALYQHGQTVWWNLSFQFLRVYHFIFRRISHGSTRLQEVLADRVAVQTYGQPAFKNGLTHVIKRDIEFNYLANKEIEAVNQAKRPFNNIYDLPASSDGTVETELEKALNQPTTEDDTHPCPADRFRFVSRITTSVNETDSQPVTDLFVNWTSLTQEMSKLIADSVVQ
jgi:Zn-dependent protease with chaperone function